MTRAGILAVKALAVSLMAAAALSSPTTAEARTIVQCPENIIVQSCDHIPQTLVNACAGCDRPVGCVGVGSYPYTWVAGCDFETSPQ